MRSINRIPEKEKPKLLSQISSAVIFGPFINLNTLKYFISSSFVNIAYTIKAKTSDF